MCTDAVELDVLDRVDIQALGQVGVYSQEFWGGCAFGIGGGLGFERGQEGLEPFEGGGVFADPDELYSPQSRGWVRSRTQVPDVFEHRGPGRDADAGANQNGDFVVEDIFCRSSVRAVDAKARHLLAVLKRDLVHAHGVEGIVVFGLRRAGAESVA